MTVIVALKDRMLCDSACISGDTHYPTEKIYRYKGELVGTAGSNKYIEKFLRWYTGRRRKPLEIEDADDTAIIVVNRGGIWDWSGTTMPDKVLRPYHGIGTGWPMAHAAMLCGKTPHEAIEVACAVTHLCGLPVQEFTL